MRFPQRALAILLFALCGVLAGFLLYRSAHRPTLRPLSAVPAASPAAAGQETQGAPQALAQVPQTVPDARIPDMAGTEKSLRDYLGHPLIINFWATWCPPCRREMPLLQQLWTHYRPDGLQILGVAVDSRSAVQQYLHATSISYPLLVGEEQGAAAVSRFGIEPVLPFSVFATAQGQIVAVKIGELHRAEADYIIAAMHQVARGQKTLPEARTAIATELRALAIQRAKAGDSDGTS